MWFFLAVVIVGALAIAGSILAGGVFTIVLVPIVAIAAVAALGSRVMGRATGADETRLGPSDTGPERTERGSVGHVPTSPERLADARRAQQ